MPLLRDGGLAAASFSDGRGCRARYSLDLRELETRNAGLNVRDVRYAMSNDGRPPALRGQALTKRYGAFTAVRDVNFVICPGQILGVLGPNGAGKKYDR